MTRHRRDPAPVERIVPGLERIRAALAKTGNPERSFAAVHVAGTNGKGATSAFAASVVSRLHPGPVGLYTSPHLLSPTERIRVDSEPIPARDLDSLLSRSEALSGRVERETGAPLSWFEKMTWAAFRWFESRNVAVSILETGLGGRWDATNVCRPAVCAITTIGIDHVDWLGGTIRAIASEKAGILKPGVPVVTGRLGRVAGAVVRARAEALGSERWVLGADFGWEAGRPGTIDLRLPGVSVRGVRLATRGTFQNDNASVGAAAAWRYALGRGVSPGEFSAAAREGLSAARWPGRFSALPGRGNRGAWVDGAHNPEAARVLAGEIAASADFSRRRPVVAIWSMLADKNIGGFVRALSPVVDRWVAFPLVHERAASLPRLVLAARRAGVRVETAGDFGEAWRIAREIAGTGGTVIVCGSLVAVADAYSERVGHI
jgi:dihydrofolate synthase/folylpolyglutamate synthase